jgi:HSP20 family protein
MRQTRWQPFSFAPLPQQFEQLQSEMNRLFNRFSDGGWARAFAPAYPAMNVWEDSENVLVEAELPGLDAKNLEIHVSGGNQLTLKGERKQTTPEKGAVHRQERGFGTFTRTLTLPYPVNADKVDARFENGVLLIKLPKHEAAKPRKIKVKGE